MERRENEGLCPVWLGVVADSYIMQELNGIPGISRTGPLLEFCMIVGFSFHVFNTDTVL